MFLGIGNTIMRCGSASAPALPTGLTLTLISGGVRVSFTDNSGGVAEHEIWAQSDGGISALLTTLNAADVSYDDTVSPVDLRYYKVRAKVGTNYSAFTAELSIAMLGAEMVDQANWYKSTFWTYLFQANWSTLGTLLVSNGAGGFLSIVNFWLPANKYKTVITITDYSYGSLVAPFGGSGGSYRSGNATYTELLNPSSADLYIYSDSFNGKLAYLSIKRVLFP